MWLGSESLPSEAQMLTLFSAPPRPRTPPIAGPVVSLTAHAAVVLMAVGGGAPGAPRSGAGDTGQPTASGAPGGERLHWVGGDPGAGGTARPGALPPVAYVIPGSGAPREGVRRPGGPDPRARRDAAPPAATPRRPPARRGLRFEVPLPSLPAALDATVLVAGVVAAAPDFARRASRPEDFVRRGASELLADELALIDVRATGGPRPDARVDELPIAFVSNPRPAYPAALARARVGGRVVVEFTIDSVGVVAPGSFRVVESTDTRFTDAVRAVLPRLRFLPAQIDRHAVGVTVRQPFVFVVRPGY